MIASCYESFKDRTKGDHRRNMVFDFDAQKLFGNIDSLQTHHRESQTENTLKQNSNI